MLMLLYKENVLNNELRSKGMNIVGQIHGKTSEKGPGAIRALLEHQGNN